MSPPEIREASFASLLVTKSIVFLPDKHFRDFRWWFINSSQTTYEGRGFGRYWGGQNRKRIFEKTRVGFGRTELSLRLSCTEFRALSSGHGPRNPWFEGGGETLDFHDLFGGVKNGKKHENAGWTWSDFGLWSSWPPQNDLLKNLEKIREFSAQKN